MMGEVRICSPGLEIAPAFDLSAYIVSPVFPLQTSLRFQTKPLRMRWSSSSIYLFLFSLLSLLFSFALVFIRHSPLGRNEAGNNEMTYRRLGVTEAPTLGKARQQIDSATKYIN